MAKIQKFCEILKLWEPNSRAVFIISLKFRFVRLSIYRV